MIFLTVSTNITSRPAEVSSPVENGGMSTQSFELLIECHLSEHVISIVFGVLSITENKGITW